MNEYDSEVAHAGNGINTSKTTALRPIWQFAIDRFHHYAWPLTNNLNVMWSDDPEDWRPINHACDPNTWLDGLDLVARRDIRPGEELTVDYATFCGPTMSAFECHCGSSDCRRVILGTDHLLPLVRKRYGDHVSDFVRGTWRNLGPDWQPPFERPQLPLRREQ